MRRNRTSFYPLFRQRSRLALASLSLASLPLCVQQGMLAAIEEDAPASQSRDANQSKSNISIPPNSDSNSSEDSKPNFSNFRPHNSTEVKEKINAAYSLLSEKKYQDAENAFRKLLAEDFTGDAYAGLAVALAKQESSAKIVEAQKIIVRGKNEFANNTNMLAAGGFVSFIHSKSVTSPVKRDLYLEAAEKLSKRVLNEDDSNLLARETLGSVYLMQNDPQGAVAPLRSLLDRQRNCDNLVLLASALLRIDSRNSEASKLIAEASKLDPVKARIQKATSLLGNRSVAEAQSELLLVPDSQRDSKWNELQGDICKEQGESKKASEYWGLANRLDHANPGPYPKLVRYFLRRGDDATAISKVGEALQIFPNDFSLKLELNQIVTIYRPDLLKYGEEIRKLLLESASGIRKSD